MPSAFVSPPSLTPRNLFTDDDFASQRAFFAAHTELSPTPLQRCPALGRHLGIGELLVKDETARFGLNAFKAAGALFAVATLRDRGALHPGDTIVCASEGNHGRAVAHAARQAGCAAKVYMSNVVTAARIEAIRAEGAEVILVKGSYDEAVRVMAADAATRGWTVVSDTSWPGYTEIPRLIMLGYTRILDEIAQQLGDPGQTVFFVPAGVGGLLAAVA
jgi:diaminopropionate ammonia-lyase